MADNTGDPVAMAAARLEAAVDRLAAAATAAAQKVATAREAGATGGEAGDGVPRETVRAMAERLDATLAKLRAILDQDEEE